MKPSDLLGGNDMAQETEIYDLEAMLKEIDGDEGRKQAEKPRAMSQDEIMKMLRDKKKKGKAHE